MQPPSGGLPMDRRVVGGPGTRRAEYPNDSSSSINPGGTFRRLPASHSCRRSKRDRNSLLTTCAALVILQFLAVTLPREAGGRMQDFREIKPAHVSWSSHESINSTTRTPAFDVGRQFGSHECRGRWPDSLE